MLKIYLIVVICMQLLGTVSLFDKSSEKLEVSNLALNITRIITLSLIFWTFYLLVFCDFELIKTIDPFLNDLY